MTNEVDEHEMAHAIGTVGEENEGKAKEKGLGDKNKTEEQVGNNNKEDNVERTPYVNTNAENKVSDRNSNLIEGKDTELRTSDTNKPQKIISEDIDEPPDSFFDELLEDDFLDSLAVVDAWTPDADDSYGSDADEKNKTREEEDRHNKKTESEDKRKDREETISRNSRGKSRRDKCEHWGSGGQNDWRRHNEVSVETKWRSRERSVDKVYIRDKDGTGEQLHIVGREMHRRYKSMKERSRERIISRRENDSRGSKERNSLRTWKGNRDSTEKNIHRRDRNSREKSTERNIHSRYRGYKDKSVEININRRESGKSTEGSVQKEDKNGDIASMSHRYSYQNRLSNKKRIADRSARESSSDLQHGVSDVCVEGKDGVVQEREQSPKVVTRKEEGPSESHRKEESSELNIANKGKRGSVHNEHNLEKTMSQGASETAKNGAENRMTEKIAGSQSHVLTKPNKPLLNNTKLDTCMKELDDLVPPGTEEDFILPTKDEALIVVDELKEEDNTYLEEKHECEIINNEFLSQDRKNALMCSFEKSSKRCMIKTENQSKKIYVISRNKDEHKMLESDKREEVSLCNTNPCLHKEVERVNSPHRTNRRRSGSNRSEGRRSSASGSKKRHHLDEVVKRKLIRCTSEEKKRSSSSLEREFEAARVRNELFNERMRKRRLLGSGREENCSRSRSRERWQRHSDPHGPKRRKDDQNDTRQLWSGGRDKKLELGLERERLGRFRSHDRQYRKIQDDIRHSRSASRDKQVRTQVGRSRSLERHYKKASSGEGWQFHVDAAQRPKRKKDVQNDSRSLVRSMSRDKQCECSLPVRISRSYSRDRQYENASSKYQGRHGGSRKSFSQEKGRRSLPKSRRSPGWDKYKQRAFDLSPVSVGHMSSSPSVLFGLPPVASERERWRSLSRSLSRERRSREYRKSVHGSSFSPVSSGSPFSCSGSFVTLSLLSDESHYRRRRRRKRSPFWKEIERKFAKDLCTNVYNQSAVYPFPSPAGTALSEGYNTSSHPALSTFPPTTVPFPADPTLYSYPSEPGFSGAVPQPPSPDNQTVPPSFGSAPPHHLELPPAPPVKPTAHILPPVPAAVYGAPPSPAPLGFIGQPATLSYSSEFPSPEKVFNRALHTIEKSQDPLQVPPPPKISQSDDEKKMSLSSLLEASVKVTCTLMDVLNRPLSSKDVLASKDFSAEFEVGGSAKRKRMSVDPELVVRCEEAIHTLQANDGMILVSPGHLVLQESSRLYSSVAAVTHASLEDVNKFRSPILRTPYPQLSFTSMPACDEETAEPFYHLPKIDFATSVEGQSQIHGARLGPHALTSSYAPGSTENLKLYVDSSTMTDIHGDEKASNNCLACLERMNRVMVWNSTQTPITEVGNKVMVWNSTQTPHASVESVGVQAQIVKMGTLRKWFARKKVSHKVKKVKTEDIVKSDNVTESVSKCSYTSHYNAGEISGSCFDMTPTAGLEEDINEEVASESTHLSPEQSLSSSSASNKGGHRDEAPFYKTSTYQGYVSNHGKNSSSLYSSGSSVKESVLPSHVSLRTVPPKGILKTRSNVELQPPPLLLPPSPQMLWQQSSQRKSDLPGSMREFGSAPDLFGMRSTSSSLGGMGTSSAMQPAASSTGSVIYGSTAASFPKFGNPSIGSTLTRDQNLYALHHNQFSPLLQGSGNPGAGLGMQSFQPQSCMAFQQTGKPSMMSHDTDSCY